MRLRNGRLDTRCFIMAVSRQIWLQNIDLDFSRNIDCLGSARKEAKLDLYLKAAAATQPWLSCLPYFKTQAQKASFCMAVAGPSRAAAVLDWLRQLPSIQEELQGQQDTDGTLLTPTSFNRKRRRPLEEMDSNIQTPKKPHKDGVISDTDQTPRQLKSQGWTSPVSLPPPSLNDLDIRSTASWQSNSDRGSESQTQSASSASSSKKRKRTPSPRKNVGLRYAAYRIDPASIESWRSMPPELQPLAKKMMIYKSGRGIVSCDYPIDELRDDIDDEHLATTERQALGDCPRAEWIKEIASSTNFCKRQKSF